MADVIPFMPSSERLRDAFSIADPIAFLDAVEACLVEGSPLLPTEQQIECFIASIQPERWFAVFSRACSIIARVDWQVLRNPTGQPAPSNPEFSNHVSQLVERINTSADRNRELLKRAVEKGLANFPPAYNYLDAFDHHFGNDSPLDYINDALGILSPAETFRHSHDNWFECNERIELDQVRLELLVSRLIVPLTHQSANDFQSGDHAIEAQSYQGGRMRLGAISRHLEIFFTQGNKEVADAFAAISLPVVDLSQSDWGGLLTECNTIEGFLAFLLRPGSIPLPQGLLVAATRRAFDTDIIYDEAWRAGFYLLNWPVATPANDWPSIQAGLFDPNWIIDIQAQYPMPADVPFIPCRMLEGSMDPFGTVSLSLEISDDDFDKIMQCYSDKLTSFSIRELNGQFPWSPEKADANWCNFFVQPTSKWCVLLHLLSMKDIWSNAFFDPKGMYGTDLYGDDLRNGYVSFKNFEACWKSANREGLAKLGNALFAFYLVRKIIDNASDNQTPQYDWSALSAHLDQCMTKPGAHWVKMALAISKQACVEKGWSTVWLRLDSLSSGSNTNTIEVSGRVRADAETLDLGHKAEQRLSEEHGDLWLLLSPRAQRMLCQAEARFERDSRSFGLESTDYGHLAVDYARIFEIELDLRLKEIFLDDTMQAFLASQVRGWKRTTDPTLGSYVLLLDKVEKMPDELLSRVQSKVGTLNTDKNFLGDLKRLSATRNKGAHTEHVSAQDATNIRELLHSGRFLHRFLKAIAGSQRD